MRSMKRSTCPDAFNTGYGVTAGHSICKVAKSYFNTERFHETEGHAFATTPKGKRGVSDPALCNFTP
eukprot:2483008-Pyramimonas_sp.AAC.1